MDCTTALCADQRHCFQQVPRRKEKKERGKEEGRAWSPEGQKGVRGALGASLLLPVALRRVLLSDFVCSKATLFLCAALASQQCFVLANVPCYRISSLASTTLLPAADLHKHGNDVCILISFSDSIVVACLQQMRVVQRNLVYAVGLPLSLCREEVRPCLDPCQLHTRTECISSIHGCMTM